MYRPRIAALLAILFVLTTAAGSLAGPPHRDARGAPITWAAAVGWPVSTGLLLDEVVTGGVSASDEYVEIANAASEPLDLKGLELVYVTSSGATVTRKTSWAASLVVEAGHHLLIANAAGKYAAVGDTTYSGGLAATGGSLVLRAIGGAPVDAVGWGDAANAFVEGSAAAAPPAGSSIERDSGDSAGIVDTNDNAADWRVLATPVPQGLSWQPSPTGTPSPSPSPSPTTEPTPTDEPTASPSSTPSPTTSPTEQPTASPTSEPTLSPTPEPTSTPTDSPAPTESPSPTPEPTSTAGPSPTPGPTATPAPVSIAVARGLPDDAAAVVQGSLTTSLGAVDGGKGGWIQDDTGGLALVLSSIPTETWPAGSVALAAGAMDTRYGERIIRVQTIELLGSGALPAALQVETGAVGEAVEGLRVTVIGTVTDSPGALSDGLGATVDDGTGGLRIVVGPAALGSETLVKGERISVSGPVNQRDSSGTGVGGYRIMAMTAGDLTALEPEPTASPSPSPTPTVSPEPTPSPSPSPSPTASASPSPTASPAPALSIAQARATPLDQEITIRGIVTAEPDVLASAHLIVVADDTAGIVVHLPGDAPPIERGDVVVADGTLSQPYGQLELRVDSGHVTVEGADQMPAAVEASGATLGEALEGSLVVVEGHREGSVKSTGTGLSLTIADDEDEIVRIVTGRVGLSAASFPADQRLRITGIVGQRATGKGKLDGYRVWPRDPLDVEVLGPLPSDEEGEDEPEPSPTATPAPQLTIKAALTAGRKPIQIEGTVTTMPGLLDKDGRRIVVDDGTAAVALLLPKSTSGLKVGDRLRLQGTMGTLQGAPRLEVKSVQRLATAAAPAPLDLAAPPDVAQEWRLVRVTGDVEELVKLGDRWHAELATDEGSVPVTSLAASGIPVTSLSEGRSVTIVGIVRRPASNASDQRFFVTPRAPADVVQGAAPGGLNTPAPSTRPSPSRRPATIVAARTSDRGGANGSSGGAAGPSGPVAAGAGADLVSAADLAGFLGRHVHVGGTVVSVEGSSITLNDGTGRIPVRLTGRSAAYLPLIEVGDAVSVGGRVDESGGVLVVTALDDDLVERAASLGALVSQVAGEGTGDSSVQSPAAANPSENGFALSPAPERRAALAGTGLGQPVPALAGLGSLVAIALVSIAFGVLRRRHAERDLAARITSRLDGLLGASPPVEGA